MSAAINEQNLQAAAGTIGSMPLAQGQEKQYTGKVQGRLSDISEFGNIILKANGDGTFVYMKDVARIESGQKANNVVAKFNGYPSVGFGIQLTSDANAMNTVRGVQAIIERQRPNLPPNLYISEIFDSTDYIRASINEVAHTFFEA